MIAACNFKIVIYGNSQKNVDPFLKNHSLLIDFILWFTLVRRIIITIKWVQHMWYIQAELT